MDNNSGCCWHLRVRTLDDEEYKPGATQIPLISDLVFDETLPLRPPKKSASRKKTLDPRKIQRHLFRWERRAAHL